MSETDTNSFAGMAWVDHIPMRVDEIFPVANDTKVFRLRSMRKEMLPRFEAGAHIEVEVKRANGQHGWNAYSLIGNPVDRSVYEIAVQREEKGRGGSRYLHDIAASGTTLRVRRPVNGFSLDPRANEHLLIAGGIGITPIYALSVQLSRLKVRHRLIFCVRDAKEAPLLDRLKESDHAEIEVHADNGEATRFYDFDQLLAKPIKGQVIYVCGPQSLIRTVTSVSERHGWGRGSVRLESFGAIYDAPHPKLEVHLARRNKTIVVEQPESIVDAMVRNGFSPIYGCKRGECGLCAVSVMSGQPLHRDTYLSEQEKESEKYMCLCVSWSNSRQITLDV